MNWEPARLKEIRATLDSLHLPCRSTRGEIISFTGEGLRKTIELNRILGADTLVSVRGPQPTGEAGDRTPSPSPSMAGKTISTLCTTPRNTSGPIGWCSVFTTMTSNSNARR